MYEVRMCSPWMQGGNSSYRWTWFGRSNGQSQQVVQESKYSKTQSNFKQKSVIKACMMIINSITWISLMWSDIWRWVSIAWLETNLFLPIGGTVFKKTEGSLIKFGYWLHFSLNFWKWCIVHRDPNFGDFRGPKFTSFSMEGSGRKYFGKSIVRAFKYCTCEGFR